MSKRKAVCPIAPTLPTFSTAAAPAVIRKANRKLLAKLNLEEAERKAKMRKLMFTAQRTFGVMLEARKQIRAAEQRQADALDKLAKIALEAFGSKLSLFGF